MGCCYCHLCRVECIKGFMGHQRKCLESPHKVFCHTFLSVYITPNSETMLHNYIYIEVQSNALKYKIKVVTKSQVENEHSKLMKGVKQTDMKKQRHDLMIAAHILIH